MSKEISRLKRRTWLLSTFILFIITPALNFYFAYIFYPEANPIAHYLIVIAMILAYIPLHLLNKKIYNNNIDNSKIKKTNKEEAMFLCAGWIFNMAFFMFLFIATLGY